MKRTLWIILFLLLLGLTASIASAQGQQPQPVTDDQVNAVARQLYCPVCENIPLDVCPTQACAEWRELIRLKLSEGWSAGQIKTYFAQQYGDRVLAAPPARGLNWLFYVLAPIAILAGIYILFRVFKSWRQPATAGTVGGMPAAQDPSGAPPVPTSDDPYIARLEEELKKL